MFFSLLTVAAVAFNGVLSDETIAQISCDGTQWFGAYCAVSKANVSDIGILEAQLIGDSGSCPDGNYYLEVKYGRVVLMVFGKCSGLFNIVKIDLPPYTNGTCGVNIDRGGFRIIDGLRVPVCKYPWMVWIKADLTYCGGFIIDKDYIITSAQCVYQPEEEGGTVKPDKVKVFSGSNHKRTGVERSVKQVFRHPGFNAKYYYNDIAMLKLNESIKFDRCHSPVCIGTDINYPGAATNCIIMGWGSVEERRTPNNWLRWTNETVISVDECKKEFQAANSTGGVFCGDGSNNAFCTGDLGSPLICLDENRWFAFGIMSGEKDLKCSNRIELYTNIPFYSNWIQQTMDSP